MEAQSTQACAEDLLATGIGGSDGTAADELLGQGEGGAGGEIVGHDVMGNRKMPIIPENATPENVPASSSRGLGA